MQIGCSLVATIISIPAQQTPPCSLLVRKSTKQNFFRLFSGLAEVESWASANENPLAKLVHSANPVIFQ